MRLGLDKPTHGGWDYWQEDRPLVTPTIEEYLEAIYTMQGEDPPVIGARVAERMGVSAPTMTETLKRMVRQGYVSVDDRKEIALTEKGREVAESLVRRHRLSERWLRDVLGLDWSKLHQEACKLEHALSPEVEEKLAESLNHPSTCPHGNPIPGSGHRPAEEVVTLNRAKAGDEVMVARVSPSAEEDPLFIDYLARTDLLPGAELRVVEVAPWAGVVIVSRGDDTITIGMQAASQIWVQVKS